VLFASAAITCGHSEAQEISLEATGLRVGASPGNGRNFHEVDAVVNLNLPLRWDFVQEWYVQTRLDLAAGWIADPGGNGAIGQFGPTFLLGKPQFPFSLEAGISPTLLSRFDFDTKNFGMPLQFTSHGGVNFDFSGHFRIGYRFQHMSNAGLHKPNPGLNLHMLCVSYLF
jgi:hypothetical protein